MDGDANYIKVKVGDRIKFTWDGNHDVTWMGDVSDCDTMASKPPTVPGYDSSPFTMLALPDWDGAVVSFGCSVGGHCGMGQNMQIQFGDEVDKALSKGVCKGGAPLFNVAPWSKVDAKFAACSVWDDPLPSLAGLVTSVDDLSTLLTAVSAAGLVDTLSGDGTFTVFAPNNKAFAAIPEKNLTALLADKDQLKQVILYHVLASQVLSTDLKNGEQMVETASGGALWVTKSSDGVTVANSDRSIVANVITADNMANNGVAHIIDAVLLPPSSTGDNDDAAVTKTSTPTTVEDDDDVIDRDVVFDAFSWSDDCEKGTFLLSLLLLLLLFVAAVDCWWCCWLVLLLVVVVVLLLFWFIIESSRFCSFVLHVHFMRHLFCLYTPEHISFFYRRVAVPPPWCFYSALLTHCFCVLLFLFCGKKAAALATLA